MSNLQVQKVFKRNMAVLRTNRVSGYFMTAQPAYSRRLLSTERKRKAVFVAGTMQHHGKTTITLGMVHALLQKGLRVAYQKPVGQQTVPIEVGSETLQV